MNIQVISCEERMDRVEVGKEASIEARNVNVHQNTHLAEQHADSRVVDEWAASKTDHLKHICDGILEVAMLLAVEVLRVHDDHKTRAEPSGPDQLAGDDSNLDGSSKEEVLNKALVLSTHTAVEESNSKLDGLAQSGVLDLGQMGLQILL